MASPVLPLTAFGLRALLVAARLIVDVGKAPDGPRVAVLAREVLDDAHSGRPEVFRVLHGLC